MPSSSSFIPRNAASGELRAAATQRGQVKMQEVLPLYGVDGCVARWLFLFGRPAPLTIRQSVTHCRKCALIARESLHSDVSPGLVIIAPPLLNDGLAAPGAREAPNDEARVPETGPAGRS
jgi:hypothetical protein